MDSVQTIEDQPLTPPAAAKRGIPLNYRQLASHLAFYIVAVLLNLLTAAIFLQSEAAGAGWARDGFPLDDTWIHLVYARSLAEHGWFFYNLGVPEAGMSSPLWVILLAIPLKLGVDPVLTAKSLGIGFGVLASIAVYHLCIEATGSRIAGWVAGIFIAIEPNFSFAKVSGMEVALFAFLLLISLFFLIRRQYVAFGITLGLAVITRGEAAVFGIAVGGVALLALYLKRQELTIIRGDEIKHGAKLFLPALLLGGAWSLYNFSVSGNPLPNTYYVKHYFGIGLFNPESLAGIWSGYLRHATLLDGVLAIPSIAIIALGTYYVLKRNGLSALPIVIAPWLLIYALSLNFMLSTNEWNFAARRHLDYTWPLLAVLATSGLVWLWKSASARKSQALVLALPLILLGYALLLGRTWADRQRILSGEYSWNTRNIEEVSVAMGNWLAANVPESARIAVSDAGAMRFFGEHATLDFLGLNMHEVIGRRLDELILEYRPEYSVLFRSDEIDGWPFLEEIYNIKPERNTILGGHDLVVYRLVDDT